MKTGIHPEYSELIAACSCGNVIETRSKRIGKISLEVCSHCHPFYTGKQRVSHTGGRVDRFNKLFGRFDK